ncbi:MAG: hypothetical protein NC483_07175 [Ruminococcus sp.]|nr:hypothetical protein [Ruminococcus sp.]
MKFERNKNSKKYFLCGLIMVVVLTITVTFITSKANYHMTASIPLTEGKVVSSPYDFNIVAIYIDGVEQPKGTPIPISGYTINEEQSYCCKGSNCKKENKDTAITLKTIAGLHTFNGISKSEKCFLYFDKIDVNKPTTMKGLLQNYYINKKTRLDGTFNETISEETKNTIYVAPDGENNSYYFAGNPLDNWVEFGGYYWRIIRVNGNGSIRLIYQGAEPNTLGKGISGNYAFNNNYNDNMYVGYWYQSEVLRGLKNPSIAYTELNNWFEKSNIKQESKYFNKIDPDVGFCGDRTPSSSNTQVNGIGGTTNITTYYGAYIRVSPGGATVTTSTKTVAPSLNCPNKDDLYTYSGAKEGLGNHKLANPVGLITADEVAYAGMAYGETNGITTNYLYTGEHYWTMSPHHATAAGVFVVNLGGYIDWAPTNNTYKLYPVINLRSDVTFTGDGTISNPYKVVIS